MKNIGLFLLVLTLLTSCTWEDSPKVSLWVTLADSTVDVKELYFNAYQVEGDQVTRVARSGHGGVNLKALPGFKNEYPFVYGSLGFPLSFVSNTSTGFFEVELHTSDRVVTKRFGEIEGNSTRQKFETFIRADTVITVY